MENLMKIRSIALSLLLAFSGMSLVAMQDQTHYKLFGVSKDAEIEDITRQYKKMALQNHPDKNPGDKASEERMKSINDAYETLSDAKKRAEYDQFIAGNQQQAAGGQHFAGNGNVHHGDAYDQVMLLAGIASAKTTYSYLRHALTEYTMHKHLSAVKKQIALQIKNKQENKPVTCLRNSLDLTWLTRLRQEGRPSPIEQAIDQFDKIATQTPQHLPAVGPQVIKIVNTYSDAIGTGKTSLFKAAAIVGTSIVGYLTSDKWLPQVLNSRLFYIALRLFS